MTSRRSPSPRSSSASRSSAVSRASGKPLSDISRRRTSPDHTSFIASASVSGVPETCPRTSRSTRTSRRRSSRDLGSALRRSNSPKVPTMSSISESPSGGTTCSATPPSKHSLRASNTTCLLSMEVTAITLTALSRAAPTRQRNASSLSSAAASPRQRPACAVVRSVRTEASRAGSPALPRVRSQALGFGAG